MTNKLVVVINSLNIQKIKKLLLYEMKILVPNYSCLQNPWLGVRGLLPPDPLSLSSVLNWICWTPTPNKIPGYATVLEVGIAHSSMLFFLSTSLHIVVFQKIVIQPGLIVHQGYFPAKCCANRNCANQTQSQLKTVCFLGVRGLRTLPDIVCNCTSSGHMDL